MIRVTISDPLEAVSEDELDAADKLCEHASVGPWHCGGGWNNGGCPTSYLQIPGHNQKAEVEMLEGDPEFIVGARPMMPRLIADLRKVRRQLRDLHDLVDQTDPHDAIGVALTRVGLERRP